MMRDLPGDIRHGEQQRDYSSEPNPRLRKVTTLACEQQCENETGAEKCDRVFVLNAETCRDAEPKPEARGAAVKNADEQVNAAAPEERLERVQRIEIADREINESAERARARERHRPGATAELASDGRGNKNCGGVRKCRQKTQGDERR